MILFYVLIFILLIFFSAFFSSAETSLMALNKIKLGLRAKKKNKKALLITRILKKPGEFFGTILIGNNFVNIAAASISTIVCTKLMTSGSEQLILLTSTVITTIIILFFAEILPKSYAFRHNERMSNLYAYPIRFFSYLFYPFVKVTTFFSNLLFRDEQGAVWEKELSLDEIKHFLASHIKLFNYDPESLRMMYEIIDIAEKDIKSIMTPRLNIIALQEGSGLDELKKIILGKKISKVPLYRENLDNITGIIHASDILAALFTGGVDRSGIKKIARPPIFISEYSPVNFALKQFRKHRLKIAVIIDEYGSTIGILTLTDIFREIMGEIKFGRAPVIRTDKNSYLVKGDIAVEEVNGQLHLNLPCRADYTTMSGFFMYHFGRFPREKSQIRLQDTLLVVKRMGKRKIDEILLVREEKPRP